MNVLQRHEWLAPIIFAFTVLFVLGSILYASGAMDDVTSTHASRMCDDLNSAIARQERAMTVCYNDPECRLGEGDFAEITQMRAIKPRVCAGLPALPLQPVATPFPFTFPEPGTTARE